MPLKGYSTQNSSGVCFRCVLDGKAGYASTENCTEEEAKSLVLRALDNAGSIESEEKAFIHEKGDACHRHIFLHSQSWSSLASSHYNGRDSDQWLSYICRNAAGGSAAHALGPGHVLSHRTIPNAWGSFNIDDEGTPARRNVLIENGILKNYMIDKLNGRRMGMAPTGMPAGLVENHASESVLNGYRHGARFDITRVQHGDCLAGSLAVPPRWPMPLRECPLSGTSS